MSKVGVGEILSRVGVQKSIQVGFPNKKDQAEGSMKIFGTTRDRLSPALMTEGRQQKGEVRHEDRAVSSDLWFEGIQHIAARALQLPETSEFAFLQQKIALFSVAMNLIRALCLYALSSEYFIITLCILIQL